MQTLYMLLFLLATVLFILAAAGKSFRAYSLQAAGLACFSAVFLIQAFRQVT